MLGTGHIHIILIVIAVTLFLIIPLSYAQNNIISVNPVKNSYATGDVIVLSGQVLELVENTPVTLHIFLSGNLVDIAQVPVEQDGSYSHTFIAQGPLWTNDGTYIIKANIGVFEVKSCFEFFVNPAELKQFSELECQKPMPKVITPLEIIYLTGDEQVDEKISEYNTAVNWQKLKPLLEQADDSIQFLEDIIEELGVTGRIVNGVFDDTTRYNPDGTETEEYLDALMNRTVHVRFKSDYVMPVIDNVNDGMSLSTAVGIVDQKAEKAISNYENAVSVAEQRPDTIPEGFTIFVDSIAPSAGGDIVTIKGHGASVSQHVIITILAPNGEEVTQLTIVSTGTGDFSTVWLAKDVQAGVYTILANDPVYTTQTSFSLTGDNIPESQPEPEPKVPEWVRNIFIWYAEEKISEDELLGAIQFLLDQGILKS